MTRWSFRPLVLFIKGPYGNTSSSFRFPFGERGGRGLRPTGNTKPEEKLEENRGGLKINLRKISFLKNLGYFYMVPR